MLGHAERRDIRETGEHQFYPASLGVCVPPPFVDMLFLFTVT